MLSPSSTLTELSKCQQTHWRLDLPAYSLQPFVQHSRSFKHSPCAWNAWPTCKAGSG